MVREAVLQFPGVTIPEALQLALEHHQAGRLAEAEGIYRKILAVAPNHADALHLLGVIAHQMGRHDFAVELIGKAIALVPAAPTFHCNLGEAYRKLHRLGEAIAAYRRTIELKPDYLEAHNNLGVALVDQGHAGEAICAFRVAIELKPDYAEAFSNLGNALKDQGRIDEALAAHRRAIQLKPDFPEAHNNLGVVLKDQGSLDDAMAAFHRAIELRPDYAEAYSNLGNALTGQGHAVEAEAAYRMAIQLQPDFAEAQNNLGNMLVRQGKTGEAVTAFRRAIHLMPDYPEAHNNMGGALKDQGCFSEAVAAFRRAIELKPDYVEARSNLLFCMHYLPDSDVNAILAGHCEWEEAHAWPLGKSTAPHGNDPDSEHRLRIGYVSPDFREHPVATFIESLLASHDRSRVEVFCYADLAREDGISERLRGCADQWRRITGKADGQVAELIRKDGIDILVDLAGHTAGNRLLVFARKPAPVQVTYLGYPDTTGLKAMDYRLTDGYADPPGTTEHLHSEELMRLPDSAWCYRTPMQAPLVNPSPVLRSGHITFGSFNARPKMNETILALWSKLLLTVQNSSLVLKNLAFRELSVRQQALASLEKAGISPERVELTGHVSVLAEHLATYGRVDIALDTYPYHGTTTTCEALWMGVPVITLAGRTHVNRVGVSLLTNAGLPELIADTAEQYVEIAAKLAADIPRLTELRANLRERMASSPLMDAPRFARNVEEAYRQMWRAWCAKQCSNPPA